MLFNSLEFAVFLSIFFSIYWFVLNKNLTYQNIFILIGSYFFYGCWDVRFLSLILLSTCVDFLVGLKMDASSNDTIRKRWLWLSLAVNLGLLGFFKYYNFFIESFVDFFSYFGISVNLSTLSIILPVGISFYTFQTLSYTIDIYRKKLKPTNNFINFAAYVSFFPQLVAGPIERATHLLPQFQKERRFTYEQGADGLRQILWGLFTKVVIADNCAVYANYIFENSTDLSGSTLLIGGLFFTFQAYGDFSGYSDIAIGTARLLGFNLRENFNYPFFARNTAEFWRRWHISLMSWFRDYVYISLGGNRVVHWKILRNITIVFFVSGLWHGANWTFINWGLYNALLICLLIIRGKHRDYVGIVAKDRLFPSLLDLLKMLRTVLLFAIGLTILRSENMVQVVQIFDAIFSASLFELPSLNKQLPTARPLFILIIFMLVIDWIGRREKHALANFAVHQPRIFRYLFYYIILFFIAYYGGQQQEFFYFQF